jgi:hypothetical protein
MYDQARDKEADKWEVNRMMSSGQFVLHALNTNLDETEENRV